MAQGYTQDLGATGPAGATGPGGINAYSTTYGFTQPAVGAVIAIQIPSGYWIQQGQFVYIPSGGYYQVASGAVPTFSLQNLGYSGNNIPVGSTVATAMISPGGVIGATGPQGPAGQGGGGGGGFSGFVGTPTSTWNPTGSFSGTYDVFNQLVNLQTVAGAITGVAWYYPIKSSYFTSFTVSVIANNGITGVMAMDIKADFSSPTSTVVQIGTGILCYQNNTNGASGWTANLIPTGSSVGLLVSTPSGVAASSTGTVNWAVMSQVFERGGPQLGT